MYIFLPRLHIDLPSIRSQLYNIIRKSSSQEPVLGVCEFGRGMAHVSTQRRGWLNVTAHNRGPHLPGVHPPRATPSNFSTATAPHPHCPCQSLLPTGKLTKKEIAQDLEIKK